MLRVVKELHGAVLRACDGELGRVDEILFDDQTWAVRYFVVDTGGWLRGRKVLLAPMVLGAVNWKQQTLDVNVTRSQVKDSPGVDTNQPVSRQWETETHDYYGWPYCWGLGSIGLVGNPWYASALMIPEAAEDPGEAFLRNTKDVTGYEVAGRDGDIGHVADFLVDDENWRIRCLAVDTKDWWLEKQVLLPLDWIGQISWLGGSVAAEVTQSQIQNAPYWEPGKPFSPAFLEQLAGYHAMLGGQKEVEARAEALAGRIRQL